MRGGLQALVLQDLAHGAGVTLNISHPSRIRVSTDGHAVLAFAATMPETTPQDDLRGIGGALYALLIGRWGRSRAQIILSPRGMLRDSAIRFKRPKKMFFLRSLRLAGLHRDLRFHATDKTESDDIHRYFGPAVPVPPAK